MVDLVSTPFAQSLMPAVLEASRQTGVRPEVILAQAANESQWGKHAPGNNLFGIKLSTGNTLPTTEVVNGQPVRTTGTFAAYPSPEASVAGYADFINRNPRYAAMRAAPDIDSQIAELGKSGYATDPDYGAKIAAIVHGTTFNPNSALSPASNSAAAGTSLGSAAPAPGVASSPDAGSLLSAALAANYGPAAPTQPAAAPQPTIPVARPKPPPQQLVEALLTGQRGNLLLA